MNPTNTPSTPRAARPAGLPASAVLASVAVVVAAALASGSAGLLGHPLRHGLTWAAMAVAIVAAAPRRAGSSTGWLGILGTAVLGLLMTAVDSPAVNVLAVALVAAALARAQDGLSARPIHLAALAAAALGLFRFAADSIPLVWRAVDLIGWTLGTLAGTVAGRPLDVGATFGGVNLLVLMTALTAGWLVTTAPPRRYRAAYAITAILLGHLGYLVVLALTGEMVAALPDVVLPPVSTNSRLGIWAWGNAARSLLPWNLPLLVVAIQATIAAAMFRLATWPPVDEPTAGGGPLRKGATAGLSSSARKQSDVTAGQASSGTRRGHGTPMSSGNEALAHLLRFGPILLAAILPVLSVLSLGRSDLRGKTVVAAREGFVDWDRPRHDAPSSGMYGMLGPLVESLGGRFVFSDDLAADDLARADVLLLIHPNQDLTRRPEVVERVWQYVEDGGSLLVAAEPEVVRGDRSSAFNELLAPSGIRVRRDTAYSETIGWEHACGALAHPATLGIGDRRNQFGLTTPSSLALGPRAKPLLVGRWAWSRPGSGGLAARSLGHEPGEKLGDLVLAAEQSFGRGRVVVLGDASCLHNDLVANSFPFVGRLLGYLAHRPISPQAWWRQWLATLATVGCVALVAARPCPLRLGATVVALAGSLLVCTALAHHAARVVPGRGGLELALIDGAHQEATSTEIWDDFGIGGLARTLMRNDYLPLRVSDLGTERLAEAKLLISIGPARAYSAKEQRAIHDFVESGGTFIAMVGAERAKASRELLESFEIRVPPSPVAPGENLHEPEPDGALASRFRASDGSTPMVQFYAAWPIECRAKGAVVLMKEWRNLPVVVQRPIGRGHVVVIGDTFFAANVNLGSTAQDPYNDNETFWRWLLARCATSDSPGATAGLLSSVNESDPMGTEEGTAGQTSSGTPIQRTELANGEVTP